MSKEVWSFIEVDKGKLHDTAFKMASEAKRDSKLCNGLPCGVFFGPSVSLLQELEPYGLEKIYFFQVEGNLLPEVLAENFFSLVCRENPEVVLFAATPVGAELGARLAAKLGKGFISNCVDFEMREGSLVARKKIFEGKASGYFTWLGGSPYIATVNLESLEAVKVTGKIKPEIEHEAAVQPETKTLYLKSWKLPLSEIDITEAPVVVGVGGGVKKEFMEVIENLAELLGAVIGGTRIAVFNGLIPVERQIGATGKFVSADVYIPIGISGSSRHTVGIKDVKHVVPVNIAKDAPIFKFAEIGIAGDLYEVVPNLIELTREMPAPGGPK